MASNATDRGIKRWLHELLAIPTTVKVMLFRLSRIPESFCKNLQLMRRLRAVFLKYCMLMANVVADIW